MIRKAVIINIGDELLAGRVVNTNASYLGQMLTDQDLEVYNIWMIPDERDQIIQGVERGFDHADIVLMTGGLGPTHDDITKEVLAEYFKMELRFHEESYRRIVELFKPRGIKVTEAHRQQCFMPVGAEIFPNAMGTAPGMWFTQGDKHLISLPGVPYELHYLMEHGILEKIKNLSVRGNFEQCMIRTAGVPESFLAELLDEEIKNLGPGEKMAFLPSLGEVKIRLVVRTKEPEDAKKQMKKLQAAIEKKVDPYIYGYGMDKMEHVLGDLCRKAGVTLVTAESCTGGNLARKIVSVPGSSSYYLGSTITYQNELKESWLKVPKQIIEENGAVSEQTVEAMVRGILNQSGADLAVSISGVAGPGGGSKEKPVGTIWIAWGNHALIETKKLQLWTNRQKNIEYTTAYCLNMLIKFLKHHYLA